MEFQPENVLTIDPVRLWSEPPGLRVIANEVADNVFRTDLSRPGFAIADFGIETDPLRFRSTLIGLAAALDEAYQLRFSRRLLLHSMGRFDQKVSTEAHLDGAPDDSILLLGYEPSDVISRLFVIDYTKCAAGLGLDPKAFLGRFNPTFGDGRVLLESYTTEILPFDSHHYRIVVINNSSRAIDDGELGMLGVMHKSTVIEPEPHNARYINTLLLSPAADDPISLEDIRAYINRGDFKAG